MPRIRCTAALAAALFAIFPLELRSETPAGFEPEPQWQQAQDVQDLVAMLDDWLDVRSEWPRRETPPRVRLVSQWAAASHRGGHDTLHHGRLRGLYDPDRAEILLTLPWDARDPGDVGVLLHELVHHRQAPYHWYCPAAQELPAYRLQDAWLAERGLHADVNWIAVVLEAGCTPRDIHPD